MTRRFVPLIACALVAACAGKPLITPNNVTESQVEITYVLGHSRYKYVAVAGAEDANISSFRDEHVLEARSIPLERYQDFVRKVEEVVRNSPTGKADEDCRTPYAVEVRVGDRHREIRGCRSADTEGQIGQILKEGEFLFYQPDSSTPTEDG